MKKKITIVLIIICLIAVFRIFNIGEYVSLDFIRETQYEFDILYSEHPFTVIAVYMAAYIIVTALSLPGSTVMSLAAGAHFGLLTGIVVVSFASTTGATLACSISRFILRDWVQRKFGDRVHKINEGIAKDGAFYLFTLRLNPIFPFWFVNIVTGLTKMPLRTYYWVSQIGMLPVSIVIINVGRELRKIESLSGIFSPGLILSFAILGMFPITAKKLLAFYESRKE